MQLFQNYRILRSSGGRAESMRVGSENMENLMTVVDRLDELQASSVGRRECSSTRQRTGARRMDVHVDTQSQPCPRATGCSHCPGTCDGGFARKRRLRGFVYSANSVQISDDWCTNGDFCCFDCLLTVFDEWYTVPIVKNTQNHWCNNRHRSTRTVPTVYQSSKTDKNSENSQNSTKMTTGVPVVTCLPRLYQQCNNSLPIVNKNLAIAKRSRVSCTHNTPRAFIGVNITP